MVDDSGILSLDFIVGFTIFMISFIIVATMISGLLVGLQAKSIDYDAVAYRTGVILVEDPGYAYDPAGGPTGTNTTGWEFLAAWNKQDIKRFGLAISKDTPNVLSPLKIDRFFNPYFGMSTEDYRSRLIFGDYPYRFNVTILSNTSLSPPDLPYWNYSYGDSPPPEASSIRRIVRIKQPSNLAIDLHNTEATSDFSVDLDRLKLANRSQPYQIDITKENVTIRIKNYQIADLPHVSIRLAPDGIELTHKTPLRSGSTVTTSFSPEDLAPFHSISKLYITYNFTHWIDPGANRTLYYYDYTSPDVTKPELYPVAILEVRVW